MAASDVNDRVSKIEDDLYRTTAANPGAIIRLDRIERLLAIMLKVGGAAGGLAVIWKALEVIGQVVQSKIG